MENIESHIEKDKKILDDPMLSPQMRRHTEEELRDLEAYAERHPDDHHDPTPLELYCDTHPGDLACSVYED